MTARKTLHMETTQVDAQKTAGEIISELVSSGATSINTDYKDGEVSGLRWVLRINGQDMLFDMPVRIEPIFQIFQKRHDPWSRSQYAERDWAQAVRVAWRQLLRWVQAQNAMIETGMVQAVEVYLPYMVVHAGTGQTLFQRMTETQFKALPAPEKPQ